MDHALAGPQRGKWLVSRDAEYNSQMENHTWDLVYLPNGKKAIQCKWLAKIKTDEKGEPSMDIVTAFLYGIVEEEVYMVQPPGYEDGTGRVCKCNKAIYGLKQAPRCWYNRLASALEGIGFRASACDESLFLMGEGESLVLLLVYVDDILLFSSSDKEIDGEEQTVVTPLPSEFKLIKAAEGEGVECEDQRQFQSMVGSLLYAAVHTRPDISFASETALSSVESEYMAMFHAAKEIIWLRRLLKEIGHEQTCATPLFSDSKGAIAMARNAVLHGLNKHMRIKWHWLRKEVKQGTLDPIYVKTQQQPADFLIKQLAEEPD
ncbi:hypothetical protein CLOM_g21667 [Closterium sp. NIES-68]|nr:hypothetical protein CLOM_g21667 [Closterium sp. NIES-68]